MKNKFSKSIAFVVVVAMLMAMVPAVVMAEAPVISDATVVINNVEGEKIVTVTATVTGDISEYTLLAVRDNVAYTSISDLPSDIADEDADMSPLELQVEYIDQPALEGTTISYEFPLRDREGDLAMTIADCYINVFLGGAGVEAVVASEVEKLDAPAIEVEDVQEKYYVEDEELVITYTGDDEVVNLWESKELVVKINDEELEDVTAVVEGDYFKVPAASFDEAAYENAVITIAETADDAAFYAATAPAVTFAVASRVEEATAAVVKTVEQVPNDDDSAVTITIPADTTVAGVAIAYEIVSTEGFTNNGDGTITVTRPTEDDADAIVIEFKATLTYGELEIEPITFSTSVRPAGVAIAAENVEYIIANAYGISGKSLAKVVVDATVIDPTAQTIDGFYYSETKGAFYGIVDASIATDKDTLAAALSDAIVDGTDKLYFGVAIDEAGKTAPKAADFSLALKIYLKKTAVSDITDKQKIALDVANAEPDASLKAADYSTSLKVYLKKITVNDMPVNAQ